jgi:hypothetical protein
MSLPRKTTEKDRRALKLAIQRTVDLCGGQAYAASITRVNQQTLSDYCNTGKPRHRDTFMPVDVFADLILDCLARDENTPLLDFLCALAGGQFVRQSEDEKINEVIPILDDVLKGVMTVRDRLQAQGIAE